MFLALYWWVCSLRYIPFVGVFPLLGLLLLGFGVYVLFALGIYNYVVCGKSQCQAGAWWLAKQGLDACKKRKKRNLSDIILDECWDVENQGCKFNLVTVSEARDLLTVMLRGWTIAVKFIRFVIMFEVNGSYPKYSIILRSTVQLPYLFSSRQSSPHWPFWPQSALPHHSDRITVGSDF